MDYFFLDGYKRKLKKFYSTKKFKISIKFDDITEKIIIGIKKGKAKRPFR